MAKSPRLQYGALPYRICTDGSIEILLVTSRRTRRWVIPKGWKIKGKKPAKSAAQEALEEAGLKGSVAGKPIAAEFGLGVDVDAHQVRVLDRDLLLGVGRLDVGGDACAAAFRGAGPLDRIVVFGSFHTVGPALDWLEAQGLLPAAPRREYTSP